ncbi:MAG: hypothetical protein ACKVWV_16875 [Planctomycetota bacterium]
MLHIDPPWVELGWIEQGALRRASMQVEGSAGSTIAAAAKELVADARLSRRRVVLSLASGLFDSRQVMLVQLPDRELRDVLARKAAVGANLELPECLFWARPCATPLHGDGTPSITWLVHTRRRREHLDLLLALRHVGVRIRRTITTRDALTRAEEGEGAEDGRVLVTSTGREVYVHLFRGRTLVQESRVALPSFETRAESYASVVQDVRQLSAFWAKGSRGTPLRCVELFGFSASEVEGLRPALAIAARGAQINAGSCPAGGVSDASNASEASQASNDWHDVRAELLGALVRNAHHSPDLKVRLPWRPSRIAAAAAASTALCALGAWELFGHWKYRVEVQRQQISSELRRASTMDEDLAQQRQYLDTRASLSASLASIGRAAERGFSLPAALGDVKALLDRSADVRQLSFEHSEVGTHLVVEAHVAGELTEATRRLEDLRLRLQSDARFRDLCVEPSTRVPDGEHREPLTFTITGAFVGTRS